MKTHSILTAVTCLALTGILSAHGTLMISHTFDGAGGSLDNDSLDVNNIGASTWTSNTGITDDGAISVTGQGSAYIDLEADLAMGNPDNIYTLDLVVQPTSGTLLTGGFWKAEPDAASNDHEGSIGSPWWFWRPNGELDASTGQGYSGDIEKVVTISTASAKTLRFVLDLTDATLTNNTVSLFVDGVQQGSTENFSGDEGFRYVGIGANSAGGAITSLTLSTAVIPEPATLSLLGLGGLVIWWRRLKLGA